MPKARSHLDMGLDKLVTSGFSARKQPMVGGLMMTDLSQKPFSRPQLDEDQVRLPFSPEINHMFWESREYMDTHSQIVLLTLFQQSKSSSLDSPTYGLHLSVMMSLDRQRVGHGPPCSGEDDQLRQSWDGPSETLDQRGTYGWWGMVARPLGGSPIQSAGEAVYVVLITMNCWWIGMPEKASTTSTTIRRRCKRLFSQLGWCGVLNLPGLWLGSSWVLSPSWFSVTKDDCGTIDGVSWCFQSHGINPTDTFALPVASQFPRFHDLQLKTMWLLTWEFSFHNYSLWLCF